MERLTVSIASRVVLGALDGLYRLAGDLLVHALALLVVGVDGLADALGLVVIAADEEMDGGAARLHAACGIDPGAYLEDDVVDGDLVVL